MDTIVFGIMFFLMTCSTIALFRNFAVYIFRIKILREELLLGHKFIDDAFRLLDQGKITLKHINNVKEWTHGYDAMVDYNTMMIRFWIWNFNEFKTTPNFATVEDVLKYYNSDIIDL